MNKDLIKISKFLSLILRHKPEIINLKLDKNGWANIDELIEKTNNKETNIVLNYDLLEKIVSINDKKRFKIDPEGKRIRANQGHSLNVDIELKEIKPPDILFHGTAIKFIENIKKKGINRGNRLYVHLSPNKEIAMAVGKRHGKPIVLDINSKKMFQDGYKFYLSENLIWLTKKILPIYIYSLDSIQISP